MAQKTYCIRADNEILGVTILGQIGTKFPVSPRTSFQLTVINFVCSVTEYKNAEFLEKRLSLKKICRVNHEI